MHMDSRSRFDARVRSEHNDLRKQVTTLKKKREQSDVRSENKKTQKPEFCFTTVFDERTYGPIRDIIHQNIYDV